MTPPNHQNSVFPFVAYVFATSMIFSAFAMVMILQINLRQEIITNRQNGLISQTYNRADACIISVQPNARTAEYVRSCYATAEKATGVQVVRYGDAK